MKDNQETSHWQTKPRNKADFYAKSLNVLYTQSQWAVVGRESSLLCKFMFTEIET